jgi:hypothetical protein
MTTSNSTLVHSYSYTPKKAGAVVEVHMQVERVHITNTATANSLSGSSNFHSTVQSLFGLFIDAGANAYQIVSGPHCRASGFGSSGSANGQAVTRENFSYVFRWVAPDTSAHDLVLRASRFLTSYTPSGTIAGSPSMTVQNTNVFIREIA